MKPILHTDPYGNKTWETLGERLHRLDGPAMICRDGEEFWYVDDIFLNDLAIKSLFSLSTLVNYLNNDSWHEPGQVNALLKLAMHRKIINKRQAQTVKTTIKMTQVFQDE